MISNYADTLTGAIELVQQHLTAGQIELVFNSPEDTHWTQRILTLAPINYGETLRSSFEILTRKGRSTRSYFHASITRLDSGRYEVNCYVL